MNLLTYSFYFFIPSSENNILVFNTYAFLIILQLIETIVNTPINVNNKN